MAATNESRLRGKNNERNCARKEWIKLQGKRFYFESDSSPRMVYTKSTNTSWLTSIALRGWLKHPLITEMVTLWPWHPYHDLFHSRLNLISNSDDDEFYIALQQQQIANYKASKTLIAREISVLGRATNLIKNKYENVFISPRPRRLSRNGAPSRSKEKTDSRRWQPVNLKKTQERSNAFERFEWQLHGLSSNYLLQ